MSKTNLVDDLLKRAKLFVAGRKSEGVYQRAAQSALRPLETMPLNDLLPYLGELRAKLGKAFERELQSAMGTVPARQVVFAVDGQYSQLDGHGRLALRQATIQMLDDYIFAQLKA